MSFLYNPDGEKVIVAPTQRDILLNAGWTKEKKAVEVKKPTTRKKSTTSE